MSGASSDLDLSILELESAHQEAKEAEMVAPTAGSRQQAAKPNRIAPKLTISPPAGGRDVAREILSRMSNIFGGDAAEASFERMQAVFEELDADGNGTLDKFEFAQALMRFGGGIFSPRDVAAVFEACDIDSNGQISVEEFRKVALAELQLVFPSDVNLFVTVYSIKDISEITQSFSADFMIHLGWVIPQIKLVPLTSTPFFLNAEEKREYDTLPKEGREGWLARRPLGGMLCIDDQWAENWEQTMYEGSAMQQTHGLPSIFVRTNGSRGDSYVLRSQPMLDFNNALDLTEVYAPFVSLRAQDQDGLVRYEQRYRGCFAHPMELQMFPYDKQQLELVIRMPHNKDKGRRFTHYFKQYNKIKPFKQALAEWDVYEPEVYITPVAESNVVFCRRSTDFVMRGAQLE